jgi:hypothetical protein
MIRKFNRSQLQHRHLRGFPWLADGIVTRLRTAMAQRLKTMPLPAVLDSRCD